MEMASGGTSPFRQGAGTEFCPPNWSFAMAAAPLESFWSFVNWYCVFRSKGLLQAKRRRRGAPGGATPQAGAARVWPAPPCGVVAPWPLSDSSSVFWTLPGKIGGLVFVSSNSENIARTAFLEPKTAENRNWHCGISLIGQFRKMHEIIIKCKQNM